MKNKAAALFSIIMALLYERTVGMGTDYYTKNMTSLGFTNETIRGVYYENVEYVFNMSDSGRVCPPHFELVRSRSKALVKLLEPFAFDFSIFSTLCNGKGGACCMRLPSPDAPAPPTPSYSPLPLINLGRHDLSIKGKEYKHVPYFFSVRNVHWYDTICPDNLKHAIMNMEFDLLPKRAACWVSIAYTGSPTPAPGLDQYNVTVRRSHLQWMLDGERLGRIPDEFWGNVPTGWRNELASAEEDWNELRMGYTYIQDRKLYSSKKPGDHVPCCMDLSKAEGR